MQLAFLIYPGLTALDIIGPYQVLSALPDADLRFVAKQKGEVRVDTDAFGITADYTFADVTAPDVLVVPGGLRGTLEAAADTTTTDWVRGVHEGTRYTTSVCTGSVILGAAGLLDGVDATTHWAAKALLEQYGARYTPQRVVERGRIVTAAGVSAGIDMGLALAARLADDETARAIQLAIEYDPQPPFDAGSPEKAGEALVAKALGELAKGM